MAAVLRAREPESACSRECGGELDALDAGGEADRVLVELAVELVNEVELPLKALDLPAAEAKGEDGHEPDEEEERPGAQPVARRLREGDGGGVAGRAREGRGELREGMGQLLQRR